MVRKSIWNVRVCAASALLVAAVLLIILALFEVEEIRNDIVRLESRFLRSGVRMPVPSVWAELAGLFALFIAWTVMVWGFFQARRSRSPQRCLVMVAVACFGIAAMIIIPAIVPWMFALGR